MMPLGPEDTITFADHDNGSTFVGEAAGAVAAGSEFEAGLKIGIHTAAHALRLFAGEAADLGDKHGATLLLTAEKLIREIKLSGVTVEKTETLVVTRPENS